MRYYIYVYWQSGNIGPKQVETLNEQPENGASIEGPHGSTLKTLRIFFAEQGKARDYSEHFHPSDQVLRLLNNALKLLLVFRFSQEQFPDYYELQHSQA